MLPEIMQVTSHRRQEDVLNTKHLHLPTFLNAGSPNQQTLACLWVKVDNKFVILVCKVHVTCAKGRNLKISPRSQCRTEMSSGVLTPGLSNV